MLSDLFQTSNRARQECPLSSLIFAICIEPLAEANRTHVDIKGIEIVIKTHKIGLYVDDIIKAITAPLTTIPAMHNVLS